MIFLSSYSLHLDTMNSDRGMYKAVAELNEKQKAAGKTLVTATHITHFNQWNSQQAWGLDQCMGINWDKNFVYWLHRHKEFFEVVVDPAAATIEPLALDGKPYFQARHEDRIHIFHCYGLWVGVLIDGKLVKEGHTNPFIAK